MKESGASREQVHQTSLADKADVVKHLHSLAVTEKLEIRDSVSKASFWAAGLSVAAVGWVVGNAEKVVGNQGILVLVITLFFSSIVLLIFRQRKYFDGVAKVIRTCDDYHHVFEDGYFVPDQSLYPKSWMNFSTRAWKEPVFETAFVIVLCSAATTVAAVLLVTPTGAALHKPVESRSSTPAQGVDSAGPRQSPAVSR